MIERIGAVKGQAAPVGPFSPAVVAGGFVFTSGQIPTDANGDIPEGFSAQVERTIDNLEAVLIAAGSGLDLIVKASGFLADPAHLEEYNRVYDRRIGASRPARTTVGVQLWGVALEIDCIARVREA